MSEKKDYMLTRERKYDHMYIRSEREEGKSQLEAGASASVSDFLRVTSQAFFFEVAAIPSVSYAASECSTDFNSCRFIFYLFSD